MPRPTDSNPPREIPQWNAAQIATSNQTLNSFIGGRTPTWLVAGSATSPRPNVISSIIHPQKRANLDQDSRAAAPNPSQVTRPQHLQQQQNLLSEYSQNGSGGAEDTQRYCITTRVRRAINLSQRYWYWRLSHGCQHLETD